MSRQFGLELPELSAADLMSITREMSKVTPVELEPTPPCLRCETVHKDEYRFSFGPLQTGGLINCLAIELYNPTTGEIGLMHFSYGSSPSLLRAFLQYAVDHPEVQIGVFSSGLRGTLHNLKELFVQLRTLEIPERLRSVNIGLEHGTSNVCVDPTQKGVLIITLRPKSPHPLLILRI